MGKELSRGRGGPGLTRHVGFKGNGSELEAVNPCEY